MNDEVLKVFLKLKWEEICRFFKPLTLKNILNILKESFFVVIGFLILFLIGIGIILICNLVGQLILNDSPERWFTEGRSCLGIVTLFGIYLLYNIIAKFVRWIRSNWVLAKSIVEKSKGVIE